uniref:Uncharacterized protein n=1 Tax=Oryza glumipatula TaxID=40148 RepID=A0A0E0AH09_9ORYZ
MKRRQGGLPESDAGERRRHHSEDRQSDTVVVAVRSFRQLRTATTGHRGSDLGYEGGSSEPASGFCRRLANGRPTRACGLPTGRCDPLFSFTLFFSNPITWMELSAPDVTLLLDAGQWRGIGVVHVGVGGKEDYGRKSSLFGTTTVTLVGAASPLGHSRGISLSMMDVSSGENHVLILENGRNDALGIVSS